MLVSLVGCSTYPSKFKCGDARGLGCTMLREVDAQIDSGQIEEAYKGAKKCRFGNCKTSPADITGLKSSSDKIALLHSSADQSALNRSDEEKDEQEKLAEDNLRF